MYSKCVRHLPNLLLKLRPMLEVNFHLVMPLSASAAVSVCVCKEEMREGGRERWRKGGRQREREGRR